ncbi:MAG: DNA cytosine methyltransferase [Candidatus Odinarchaeota archaeon]
MRNKGKGKAGVKVIKNLAKLREYKAIDSFCGPGGMSLGLERAGFDVILAFDINKRAVETHKSNLKNSAIVADVNDIKIQMKPGELTLFAGGPPCQGFSKQKRNAHLGDKRNGLVSKYIDLVADLMPRFLLFENVAIFGQKRGKKYVEEMKSRLEDYVFYLHFYNSADYGLAQTRQRFVIVGRRKDQNADFRIPEPTVNRWKTVGEVLEGLPEPPDDYTDHPDYPNHQKARVTDLNIKRFSFVPQGGGWQDIPPKYRLECHKNVDTKSGGWPDVYGRLEWDGQCPTITGGFDSFTRGRYGHPLHDRPLTPREAARIQGFDDRFVFKGTRADIRSQIGNAVPPPLAEAIGSEIMRSLLIADGMIDADERPISEQAPCDLKKAV